MTDDTVKFDKQSQLQRVQEILFKGERLYAVYDCSGAGTGFVGLTSLRLIFYDQGTLTGHKSLVTVPYDRIVAVSSDDIGVVLKKSQITILTAGGKFSFEFRSHEKGRWAYRFISFRLLQPAAGKLIKQVEQ